MSTPSQVFGLKSMEVRALLLANRSLGSITGRKADRWRVGHTKQISAHCVLDSELFVALVFGHKIGFQRTTTKSRILLDWSRFILCGI